MTQHVLVGVDGSPASLHALDWAAAYAQYTGEPLRLVSSYSAPTYAATSPDGYAALGDMDPEAGVKAILTSAHRRIRRPGLVVRGAAAAGDPATLLVELSGTHSIAVVGTRGRGSGLSDRLLGSVSSTVPARAACPVVVVPFRTHGQRHARSPHPVNDWMPIRRIVVGVDGSAAARAALLVAVEQALLWQAEIVAVAGVPVGSGQGMMAWLPQTIEHEHVIADVRAGMDAVLNRVERANPGLRIRRVVLDGTGAELLIDFSTAADLLVIGASGRGGFAACF